MKRWTDDEIVAVILAAKSLDGADPCACALRAVGSLLGNYPSAVDTAELAFGKSTSWAWGVMGGWDDNRWDVYSGGERDMWNVPDETDFAIGWNIGATARAAWEAE